jgi:hypothetical protein
MGPKPAGGPSRVLASRPCSHAHQAFDAKASVSPQRRCATPTSGPCRRWSFVHQVTRLQPAGHPRASRSNLWATMASAQRSRARRVGATTCGMAGLRPSCDSTLGCAGHQCAGARPATGVRTARHSGSQKCGPRQRSRSLHTAAQHDSRLTGKSHGDGEHKDMGGPRATSRRGRPHVRPG